MSERRAALGQGAMIGALYNAMTDSMMSGSLFGKNLPPEAIASTKVDQSELHVSYSDAIADRFRILDVNAGLGASILSGLINPLGSGRYLIEPRMSSRVLHATLYHKLIRVQEKFRLQAILNSPEVLDTRALSDPNVTHFVSEVQWGVQSIISIQYHLGATEDQSQVEVAFRNEVNQLKKSVEKGEATNSTFSTLSGALDITVYSDVLGEGIVLGNAQEMIDFFRFLPVQAWLNYQGKGYPVVYGIMHTSTLNLLDLEIGSTRNTGIPQLSLELLDKFVDLFDNLAAYRVELDDYYSLVKLNSRHVSGEQIDEVETAVNILTNAVEVLKGRYSQTLEAARSGMSSKKELSELYDECTSGVFSPQIISNIDGLKKKLEFISRAIDQGVTYIGHNTNGIKSFLSQQHRAGSYILHFNSATFGAGDSWETNLQVFWSLLNENLGADFAIVDCDAEGIDLEASRVAWYDVEGEELVRDMVEDEKFQSNHCFVICDTRLLETEDIQRPIQRRFVRVPCPNSQCGSEIREWMCHQCRAPIEYGHSDTFVYCECGRCPYTAFKFKCNGENHGSDFVSYDPNQLLSLLSRLKQEGNVNLLILGESGVGKSTFINAFVNYLNFETLEDAKNSPNLNSVMPCSFQLQKTNGDEIEEVQIRVGDATRDDEHDGSKGQSATQKTTVYPIGVGTRTVRLIDTPGIGDTRGLAYDQQNMADILQTLGSYEEIHGILILLKSNNARLTVTFNFCMKELLTHLHRSAVANIAFGFTNTRISNYTPGDTFGPLKALLGQHPEVGFKLMKQTTYCFDSESFRYLAALKNGHPMPNEEDFRRSWEHSRAETKRLIDYFSEINPHSVKSTLSLNGTRQLIKELTQPLAKISTIIQQTIDLNNDKIQLLAQGRLKGDKLRQQLDIQKVFYREIKVDKPRTVCAHQDCTSVKQGVQSGKVSTTFYNSMCHAPCWLTGIQVDTLAPPGILNCYAFDCGSSNTCSECGHHWQQHMHIVYELEEYTATVQDEDIQRQIRSCADDVTLTQNHIHKLETLRKEYEEERKQIRDAMAQFAVFLKQHSIIPTGYNDATLDYLDMLIRDTESRIAAAEHAQLPVKEERKRLTALKDDRKRHIELVETLTNAAKMSKNDARILDKLGVERKVQQLYSLQHFGEELKRVKNAIIGAHESTYRERPFRVGAKQARRPPMHNYASRSHPAQYKIAKRRSLRAHPPGSFPVSDTRTYAEALHTQRSVVTQRLEPKPEERKYSWWSRAFGS